MVYLERLGFSGNLAMKVAARALVDKIAPGLSGVVRAVAVVTAERAIADVLKNSESPGFLGNVALKVAARLLVDKVSPGLEGSSRAFAVVAAERTIREFLPQV